MSDATAEGHEHPSYLQHHFDTPLQQFDSGKLGMWLFLATEILLFGGLFCAYAIYRGMHPEIFVYAHHVLDTNLGATNTVVLLVSSLTMAWAVRASQLGQQKLLIVLLILTLICGFGFMGIKAIEYSAKFEHSALWGTNYKSQDAYIAGHGGEHGEEHSADGEHREDGGTHEDGAAEESHEGEATPADDPAPAAAPVTSAASGFQVERSTIPPPGQAPAGLASPSEGEHLPVEPRNVQIFFGIYFLMTGLHGIHVLLGMGAISWLLFRASKGAFSPEYFTPVDLVGLYWHLVDLIWIFLFPLLYLIH